MDFSLDPDFEAQLEWIRSFTRDHIEPLDLVYPHRPFFPLDAELAPLVEPLKAEVKRQGLWAAHLDPELGGHGFGQVRLALMNEILGTSAWAPIVFGTAAPDTGNAEIIAHYGTAEQKAAYLEPLLDGRCFSCYSMTEPQGGADPTVFTTRATRDGDEWVIQGRKYFSSNARTAQFIIVMAITDPDVPIYSGMSMFLVPTDTPGVKVERHIGLILDGDEPGMHALIHYDDVRVPAEALLGGEGQAFAVAQTRLGGGRIHHAMRTVGTAQRALDMMCERALSRETKGGLLAQKQLVQADIAASYSQLQQFRLYTLYTAWQIDQHHDYRRVRKDIAAIKVLTSQVLHDVVYRSMHLHGALGVSDEMPFGPMWAAVPIMATVDGPTEVHQITVAREVLKDYRPAPGDWPTAFLPARRAEASELLERRRLAAWMDRAGLPGSGEDLEVRHLSGGASNEILELRRGTHSMVLRRPPRELPEGRSETMLREYRVLRALADTDVAHPRALAACDDASVLGCNFYVMERVEGWSPLDGPWPSPFDLDLAARAELGIQLVDGIARLARVDWRAAGLEGFGRPDGFHDRQVDRWFAHLARVQFRDLPGLDEAAAWLRTHRPPQWEPGILHGDYQFANVMYAHGAPARLAAIVDWEMSTIGDPLLDLGWVLNGWPDDTSDPPEFYVDMVGMPSRDAIVEHYATVSGRDVSWLDYYVVLARFKLAIVLEGGYARVVAGTATNDKMEAFGPIVVAQAAAAAELAAASRLPATS